MEAEYTKTATLGALLRARREQLGLSQDELAARAGAGFSGRTVSNIERGRVRPYRQTLEALVSALALDAAARAAVLAAWRRLRPPEEGSAARPTTTAVAATPAPAGGLAGGPGAMPAAATPLLGRERAEAEVVHLLTRAAGRLLTLTGPGGVGKTRLAVQVARTVAARYAAGMTFVDLAPLREDRLVVGAIAAAMGVSEQGGQPLRATLIAALRERHLLLLLDNAEHLLAAVAEEVVALRAACPALDLLVTSRTALRLSGEQVYPVPPLALPAPEDTASLEALGQVPAVALFVQRAQAVQPAFALTAANAAAVATLCTRLDGLPLAIELAAARVGVLPVEGIVARLDDRFRLLSRGAREVLPRQQTLRAALDWSWELLEPHEQALLARLAVFAGGCTIEAAQAVCGPPDLDEWAVLDGLDGLLSKSLLQREDRADGARYRLLETVRQYAAEQLAARGEREDAAARQLAWSLALAAQARPGLDGPEQAPWLALLDAEHDNLRAALVWAVAPAWAEQLPEPPADPATARPAAAPLGSEGAREEALDQGLRLATLLTRFWQARGQWRDGRRWLEALLAAVGEQGAPLSRARAYEAAANLARQQGDLAQARSLAMHGLDLARTVDAVDDAVRLRAILAIVAAMQSEFAQARALFEEVVAHYRAVGPPAQLATHLINLGNVAGYQGDYAEAEACYEEGLRLQRQRGDVDGVIHALFNLGWIADERGEYARGGELAAEVLALARPMAHQEYIARAVALGGTAYLHAGRLELAEPLLAEASALYQELGDRWNGAKVLADLGALALERAEYARAYECLAGSLVLQREVGDTWNVATVLAQVATLAARQGEPERAATLYGAAEALREAIGSNLSATVQAALEAELPALRGALGEETAAAWARGRALTLEEAIVLALAPSGVPAVPLPWPTSEGH